MSGNSGIYFAGSRDERQCHPTFVRAADQFRAAAGVELCYQRARDGVKLVASHAAAMEIHESPEAAAQARHIALPWNSQDVLSGAWIGFEYRVTHGGEHSRQPHASFGQHPHGAERDREKTDAASPQFQIAFTKVNGAGASAVVAQAAAPDRKE